MHGDNFFKENPDDDSAEDLRKKDIREAVDQIEVKLSKLNPKLSYSTDVLEDFFEIRLSEGLFSILKKYSSWQADPGNPDKFKLIEIFPPQDHGTPKRHKD